jgi:hypothetical protein
MKKYRRPQPQHKQVLFETTSGKNVTVDKGMYKILTELKRFDVETYFSCQGGDMEEGPDKRAYFLATGTSMVPLIVKMRRHLKAEDLSAESMRFLREFFKGYRQYEFSSRRYHHVPRVLTLERGFEGRRYTLEWGYSHYYGFRCTVRFPHTERKVFRKLLEEMG